MSRPRYTVEIAPAVRKQLKPIPYADKTRILSKINALELDPRRQVANSWSALTASTESVPETIE